MTRDRNDSIFTARALAALPQAAPPAGFERALLAAYDAQAARRGWLRRACVLVWPGAPAWAPGAAFAAALLLGVGVGAVLPEPAMAQRSGFSLEEPSSFSLDSVLTAEDR